jgi:hypothetical protein
MNGYGWRSGSMDKLDPPKTVRLLDNNGRSSSENGYDFTVWNYDGGWLIASPQIHPDKAIWVESVTDFYAVSLTLAGQETIEIEPEPIELTDKGKVAVQRVTWDWEFWEPTLKDGACLVQCLAKAIDSTDDDVKEMFKRAFRDPRRMDHAIEILKENGYELCNCGPDGFGYRERRRLVTMKEIANQNNGHVVLVYENDSGIFDSSSKFKDVSQLLWAQSWGYKLGDVFLIEKMVA